MIPWQRVRISGDDFVVLCDPDNELQITPAEVAALLLLGGEHPASGVIRAIHTTRTDSADATLEEDPAALWWCDMRSPEGSLVGTSGAGVRALVHALVDWGEITFEDRRDAIPVGTPDGVRDVLMGRAGYAVDLGRWRLLAQHEQTFAVQVGRERVVVHVDPADAEVPYPAIGSFQPGIPQERLHAFVHPTQMRIERGVAHAKVRLTDAEHADRRASSLVAAASAIILRHLGPLDTPHHWSVEMPGGSVGVRLFATEDGEHVSVSGPVTFLTHGTDDMKPLVARIPVDGEVGKRLRDPLL